MWSQSKWLFSEPQQKQVLVLICFDSFVIVLVMEVISILWISTIHILKNIIIYTIYVPSLCFYKAKIRGSSQAVWPSQPFGVFLLSTFAWVISILPEKLQKCPKLGMVAAPRPPASTPTVFAWQNGQPLPVPRLELNYSVAEYYYYYTINEPGTTCTNQNSQIEW